MENKKILIIEDEIDLLNAYKDYAGQVFYNVITATTCQEARNILNNETIDCILLDNQLPDGLGISIVKELNNKELNIPIIMITGFADKQLAIDSVNTGIFYFLEKPVKRQQIIDTLQKCFDFLAKKEAQNELKTNYYLEPKTINYLKEEYKISAREIEVISFAILNYKNTVIAQKLFISSGTVKRHLHNIFEKLEISSKEELQEIIHKINTQTLP